MKRDLVTIGNDLDDKVPFHPIIREFEINGEKCRIRVGWGVLRGARMEVYRGMRANQREWVEELWSVVPRAQLISLTKSIKEEADALIKGTEDFIDKEFEAEINEMLTDVICKIGEQKNRQEILKDGMTLRLEKMNSYFQNTFKLPTTFTEFNIKRAFDVPRPTTLPSDQTWEKTITVTITQDAFSVGKLDAVPFAMMVLQTIPQITTFALLVYTQLDSLAKWEASQ